MLVINFDDNAESKITLKINENKNINQFFLKNGGINHGDRR